MSVDLRSDTVTRPTPAMREAMLRAEVGDDVLGDDPTTRRLEERIAQLTGHAAALFMPSGTMANQVAIAVHTRPGDEVLLSDAAHPFHYEAAGAAVIAGVQLRLLPTERGLIDVASVAPSIRPDDPHFAPATLLCVEDTANRGGGTWYPQAHLDALLAAAGPLRTHLDGARAFNAAVAAGQPLHERTAGFDSVSVCFSKGLGAPVGSALCGDAAFIHRARRVRKMLGGGLRQSGFLAAAALHALEHHVDRLADDHRRARTLAAGLRQRGFTAAEPPTNLVYVEVPDAAQAVAHLAAHDVLALSTGPTTVRLVTHLDVDDVGIERTLAAMGSLSNGNTTSA